MYNVGYLKICVYYTAAV